MDIRTVGTTHLKRLRNIFGRYFPSKMLSDQEIEEYLERIFDIFDDNWNPRIYDNIKALLEEINQKEQERAYATLGKYYKF